MLSIVQSTCDVNSLQVAISSQQHQHHIPQHLSCPTIIAQHISTLMLGTPKKLLYQQPAGSDQLSAAPASHPPASVLSNYNSTTHQYTNARHSKYLVLSIVQSTCDVNSLQVVISSQQHQHHIPQYLSCPTAIAQHISILMLNTPSISCCRLSRQVVISTACR
ncbi:hypothetical protein J6590_066990 [Homalodisca vitripennis]|nr:hypothetical protein J6590_066990 [Homalodisca vitripennis]